MIYDNVKAAADKKGMSIRELEIKAVLANGTIGRWRTAYPRVDNLKAVAKVLNVSVNSLLKER